VTLHIAGTETVSATRPPPERSEGAPPLPAPPPDRYRFDQSTPRAALNSLVYAVEKQNWDDVLRLVPDSVQENDPLTAKRLREAWEGPQREEVLRKIDAIRRALVTGSIDVDGEHATMDTAGGTVYLVREHGVWKVRDF
jgi:hypothetical protein